MKNRQWYVVVGDKGMRMITEKAISISEATQSAYERFGKERVTTVVPALPSHIKRFEKE